MNKYLKFVFVALLLCFGMVLATQAKTPKKRTATSRPKTQNGVVNEITPKEFRQLVADWTNARYKFKGRRPAVVDVYAPWCGACKHLRPTLETLARQYSGRVDFYSINGDQYKEIMREYGLNKFPTVFIWYPGGGWWDKSEGSKNISYYSERIDAALRH